MLTLFPGFRPRPIVADYGIPVKSAGYSILSIPVRVDHGLRLPA
jgi:hypothetical protein